MLVLMKRKDACHWMVDVICAPLDLGIVLYAVISKNVFCRWIRKCRQFGAGMESGSVNIEENPSRQKEKGFIVLNNALIACVESRYGFRFGNTGIKGKT